MSEILVHAIAYVNLKTIVCNCTKSGTKKSHAVCCISIKHPENANL